MPSIKYYPFEDIGTVVTSPEGSLTLTGVSDFFAAINGPSESKFSSNTLDLPFVPNLFAEATYITRLQGPIIDPLVDTGWELHVRARKQEIEHTGWVIVKGFLFRLVNAVDFVMVQFVPTMVNDDPFTEYIQELDLNAVTRLREHGDWSDIRLKVTYQYTLLAIGAGDPPDYNGDACEVYLLVPPPAAGADIEITSDAGFDFGGSNYFETVSDAELIFDTTAIVLLNTFISDAELVFDCSAVMNLNAYISDAGLIFNGTSQNPVLSADCSGIYTLIPGQHFDEILSRNTADNETQDVKIPDPQGKTGYFGG